MPCIDIFNHKFINVTTESLQNSAGILAEQSKLFSNKKKKFLNNKKIICLRIIYLLVINRKIENVYCVNYPPAYNSIHKYPIDNYNFMRA